MNIYALAISVHRQTKQGFETNVMAYVCIAQSEAEAKGLALDAAEKTFQRSAGWSKPSISVCEVPINTIRTVYPKA